MRSKTLKKITASIKYEQIENIAGYFEDDVKGDEQEFLISFYVDKADFDLSTGKGVFKIDNGKIDEEGRPSYDEVEFNIHIPKPKVKKEEELEDEEYCCTECNCRFEAKSIETYIICPRCVGTSLRTTCVNRKREVRNLKEIERSRHE